MTNTDDDRSASYFSTGDVTGTGIVIGNESSVVIRQSPQLMQPELIRSLDKFVELLEQYEGSIEDASGVRESVMEVQQEIGKPMPRWAFVRTLLKGIAASVAGVATLTDAIVNVLTIASKAPH
jgi:hypothetical protein